MSTQAALSGATFTTPVSNSAELIGTGLFGPVPQDAEVVVPYGECAQNVVGADDPGRPIGSPSFRRGSWQRS